MEARSPELVADEVDEDVDEGDEALRGGGMAKILDLPAT